MSKKIELQCETIHCFGRVTTKMGTVTSQEEAREWFEDQRTNYKRSLLPESDPIRTCPVVRCPMKMQVPRYSSREIPEE